MILALESAGPRCSVALWDGGIVAEAVRDEERGHASILPVLVQEVLAGRRPSAVAVGVGPGGFTGLRAGLAVAQGLALALNVPLLGVTTGEALAAEADNPEGLPVWAAIDNKRGRIFLERPGQAPAALEEAALPLPEGPVLLAGDAAERAAAALAARGAPAQAVPPLLAHARGVARVAAAMLAGDVPRRVAQPLYIDAPATTFARL
jgi:tRNA threonylcarbamoyladenosine biosynthesis protein TsaB